jgi:hypothetical protein
VLEGIALGNFVVLHTGIYFIDRSSDERIHYFDLPAAQTRLRYFDFSTGRTTTVAANLGTIDRPLTASADGRTILYSRVDSSIEDLMLVENFR